MPLPLPWQAAFPRNRKKGLALAQAKAAGGSRGQILCHFLLGSEHELSRPAQWPHSGLGACVTSSCQA